MVQRSFRVHQSRSFSLVPHRNQGTATTGRRKSGDLSCSPQQRLQWWSQVPRRQLPTQEANHLWSLIFLSIDCGSIYCHFQGMHCILFKKRHPTLLSNDEYGVVSHNFCRSWSLACVQFSMQICLALYVVKPSYISK